MVIELYSMQTKTVRFEFANPGNKVHDNSIVLYEYFEKRLIILMGLPVGAVHSPQTYNLQLSVE